jgi:putative spermidine/putrescine transport system permease protein
MSRTAGAWLLAGPVGLAMLGLVVAPCLAILVLSVLPGAGAPPDAGAPTLAHYAAMLDSRAARQALVRTIEVSLWVTALTILAGYPLAFHIARQGRTWRGLLLAIVIFPFLLSAVVRAYGWNVVLGERGLLNGALVASGLIGEPLRLVHTETAIIIGETHLLLPYMVLALLATIRGIDPQLEAAAQSLGASPPSVFLRVLLPATLPGLLTGTLLVFALAITAFATPFLLGGTRTPLLTTLLYRYAFISFDWSRAAAVAGVLLALGGAFVALHRRAGRGGLNRLGAEM